MEIIDDLQRDGLVIVRSDSRFAYGHDAVLLTDFVRAHAGERYLDIGTGTGILAILTYAKCGVSFVAADIDGECVRMAKRSVELNKLGEHISVEQCDARTLTEAEFGRFDGAVFCVLSRQIHSAALYGDAAGGFCHKAALPCAVPRG